MVLIYGEMLNFFVLLLGTTLFACNFALPPIHLPLTDWTFYAIDESTVNRSFSGKAIVPGDIYQDLQSLGLIPDPLIGDNDKALRWIGRTDWTYLGQFAVMPELLQRKAIVLNIQGLDTIATVRIGDTIVAESRNQFDQQMVDIKDQLQVGGEYLLNISFRSPVNYARELADAYQLQYGHEMPPSCPPDEQSGECHFNFIRKVQSSFSWDWGPSFPTVGIWQPISIEAFDFAYFTQVTAQTIGNGDNFDVPVDVFVYSAITANNVQGTVSFAELDISQTFTTSLKANTVNQITVVIAVPKTRVQLWWPNGYGHRPLYSFDVLLTNPTDGEKIWSNGTRIGFRTVELVQDFVSVDATKGRHFYFKINDVPIFLKGSNWIPLSAFPARNDDSRLDFLLKSASAANMNALRVWGGGRYESQAFYDRADELGILLWQDLMFACAAYPITSEFLVNVDRELTVQVNRLKHHPSILVWAGNNENEVAIRTTWWHPENFTREQMIDEYSILYHDRIRPLVQRFDWSRPFLLSSPSNGIESENSPGSVAMDPSSELYGDIHYYIEDRDLWADDSYWIPRCATEFGIQSIPHKRTLLRGIPGSEWRYNAGQFTNRQHHPWGNFNLLSLIYSHFPLPDECASFYPATMHNCPYVNESSQFLDRFIYLTQIHQAFTYQAETEHYLRWRSRFNSTDGRGGTMCALYWQLNDIWAAPTWSSIDFDLNWKPAHYMARRFFAPILISTYIDAAGALRLFVVNDQDTKITAVFVYETFVCKKTCTSLIGELRFNISIDAFSSQEIVDPSSLREKFAERGSAIVLYDEIVDRCRLLNVSTGMDIAFENVRLGKKVLKTKESNFGSVRITSVTGARYQYEIDLVATGFAPLIWLDLVESRPGWFSDNLFTMLGDGNRTITFTLDQLSNRTLTIDDFTVCSLSNCGKTAAAPDSSSPATISNQTDGSTATVPPPTAITTSLAPTGRRLTNRFTDIFFFLSILYAFLGS